jgi:hypothetical protein
VLARVATPAPVEVHLPPGALAAFPRVCLCQAHTPGPVSSLASHHGCHRHRHRTPPQVRLSYKKKSCHVPVCLFIHHSCLHKDTTQASVCLWCLCPPSRLQVLRLSLSPKSLSQSPVRGLTDQGLRALLSGMLPCLQVGNIVIQEAEDDCVVTRCVCLPPSHRSYFWIIIVGCV